MNKTSKAESKLSHNTPRTGAFSWLPKLLGREATPADNVVEAARSRPSLRPDEFPVIYAIGDVHGCYDQLLEAERRIREDAAIHAERALVVLLGDYLDRGHHSREVIEHLCRPAAAGHRRIALCGNHDEAFRRLLEKPETFPEWSRFAGPETLASYGVDAAYLMRHGGIPALDRALRDAVPTQHRNFLEELPSMLTVGDIVFVHAGLRPGVPLLQQRDSDLLWIREPFLARGPELPMLVVHGHTPVHRPFFGNGRIAIDTGAFATGRLTVLRIMNRQALVLN
jgi:serine/threonine protein phosphatase 1